LSEKQIPQVVENLESGGKPKEDLETAALRPRQVRYQAALRPDNWCFLDFKPLSQFPIPSVCPNRPKELRPAARSDMPFMMNDARSWSSNPLAHLEFLLTSS
jgi:hypothetical protein